MFNLEQNKVCNKMFSNFMPSVEYTTSHSVSTVHKCHVVTHAHTHTHTHTHTH